jgi:hypothetical protein
MNLREGDNLLVRARIVQRIPDHKLFVEFKNGDSLPLTSVEVASVEQYKLRLGDRIAVPEQGTSPFQGEVKAIIHDVEPPQVVYKVEGSWVLKIMPLTEVRRL